MRGERAENSVGKEPQTRILLELTWVSPSVTGCWIFCYPIWAGQPGVGCGSNLSIMSSSRALNVRSCVVLFSMVAHGGFTKFCNEVTRRHPFPRGHLMRFSTGLLGTMFLLCRLARRFSFPCDRPMRYVLARLQR